MPLAGLMARSGDLVGPGAAGVVMDCGMDAVLVNGLPAAALVPGVMPRVTPHVCCNPYCPQCCAAVITVGIPTVLINGKPAIVTAAPASCGHVVITGAEGVIVTG